MGLRCSETTETHVVTLDKSGSCLVVWK